MEHVIINDGCDELVIETHIDHPTCIRAETYGVSITHEITNKQEAMLLDCLVDNIQCEDRILELIAKLSAKGDEIVNSK